MPSSIDRHALAGAVNARMALATSLFKDLSRIGADGEGITRAPYGEQETAAHDLIRKVGGSLGLHVRSDPAKNTYVTLRGRGAARAPVIIGSHLDSVVCGGNYDGAAGVVAGLAAIAALGDVGSRPDADISVMAIRGEEGDWFGLNHVGTRAALGLLTAEDLNACRVDTRQPLAQHMVEAGCNVEAIRSGDKFLEPGGISAYFELHIEQGPVLEALDIPVGIVSGIRGSVRAHAARCVGTYAHSGAVPMRMRKDAVRATVELAHALYREWEEIEGGGGDLVLTFGKFHTDTALHQLSKVPGEVRFTIDVRSIDQGTLDFMASKIIEHAKSVEREIGVDFQLGTLARLSPAKMDPKLVDDLRQRSTYLAIPANYMASGAGHDAADFAKVGVPTAMIFIRNYHGSHNPAEDISIEDFRLGTQLLADVAFAAAST